MYAYVQQGTNVKVNSLFYNGKKEIFYRIVYRNITLYCSGYSLP